MNGTEIAVVLTSAATLAGVIFAAIRELRKDKVTAAETETALAMASQTTLIKTLQAELSRVQEDFARERMEWRKERDELRAEVVQLKARVKELEEHSPAHGTPAITDRRQGETP